MLHRFAAAHCRSRTTDRIFIHPPRFFSSRSLFSRFSIFRLCPPPPPPSGRISLDRVKPSQPRQTQTRTQTHTSSHRQQDISFLHSYPGDLICLSDQDSDTQRVTLISLFFILTPNPDSNCSTRNTRNSTKLLQLYYNLPVTYA